MSVNNTIFNQHWQTYQTILKHNYMGHDEIFDVFEKDLKEHCKAPFRLLDIGSGDAQTLCKRLSDSAIIDYVGIDLSAEALCLAHQNVSCIARSQTLINSDFVDAINELVIQKTQQFDVVFSGFALHHVTDTVKMALFNKISALLTPGGRFYYIDVYHQPQETRDEYLERYLATPHAKWDALSLRELALLDEHVRSSDFPSSISALTSMANNSGFVSCDCLFEDTLHSNVLLKMAT